MTKRQIKIEDRLAALRRTLAETDPFGAVPTLTPG